MVNNLPLIHLNIVLNNNNKYILNLVDSALEGDSRSIQMAIRRLASKIRTSNEDLYSQLSTRLSDTSLRNVDHIKSKPPPTPVDSDSRLNLIRIENPVLMENQPIHSKDVHMILEQVILERKHSEVLIREGVYPSKSLIFQGPPGVGKTMSARWLAEKLKLPLLVLDLATVMSSFLGKTGSNVRAVLDHAASFPCVLLLDEFDAIAKRRDDDRELGELKRLVTVLLQAIDDWPNSSLLIAATNHGELLDPAIWRRFDIEVIFKIPNKKMVSRYLKDYWPDESKNGHQFKVKFDGKSFSYIDREIKREKRESILSGLLVNSCLVTDEDDSIDTLSMKEKKQLAKKMYRENGMTQRSIAKKLGISRPTVKKAIEMIGN